MSTKLPALFLLATTASSAVMAEQSPVDAFIAANSGGNPPTSENSCIKDRQTAYNAYSCLYNKISELETVRNGSETYRVLNGNKIYSVHSKYQYDTGIRKQQTTPSSHNFDIVAMTCHGVGMNLENMGDDVGDDVSKFFNKYPEKLGGRANHQINYRLNNLNSFLENFCP